MGRETEGVLTGSRLPGMGVPLCVKLRGAEKVELLLRIVPFACERRRNTVRFDEEVIWYEIREYDVELTMKTAPPPAPLAFTSGAVTGVHN